ncbi:MAG: aldehyde ferredoxin oxidoreductase N-terminal domain-containing protein [Euryarchaeota archaeon]|nr:aldehyde ferredoxin oxidoreductase N-terminal domain-containing protein [Euryarchaeota archaeon]
MAVIGMVCDARRSHEYKKRRGKMYGWRETITKVDLTRKTVTKQPLNEPVARNFIGGRVLNSKTLFDEVKPGISQICPENVLCLAPGHLTGTPLCMTSRIKVSTLSPCNGILGDGNAGGSFAAFLKPAGLEKHAEMLIDYYRVHGYDPETGVPTWKRLERMELGYVAEELGACNPYSDWDGAPLWQPHEYPHGTKRAFVNEHEA